MKKLTWMILLLLPALIGVSALRADEAPAQAFEALLRAEYPADQPGAAVIVRKDGRTLCRAAVGMADLELGVPLTPDMVFRLGSVTKQFTGVAILMLEEEGKLRVGDAIQKYLPDFPDKGKPITVEHLLAHTSGIKSYTSLPEWLPLWRKDMKLEELIALFRDLPLEFDPGTRWNYSNSGYILLGAIIEKVSGKTYADFIDQRIFKPLGMNHSHYGDAERLIPRRVKGYQPQGEGFINAPYLSMTQPYAAGSLLSTVDDLARWHEALLDGRLVRPDSLRKAHQPVRLSSGESTAYGYGWMMSDFKGHQTVEHGGGINGFATYAISLPQDGVYVAILQNHTAKNPESLAFRMAALAAGIPLETPPEVAVSQETLMGYVGVYEHEAGGDRVIRYKDGKLSSQRDGGIVYVLRAVAPDEFIFPTGFTRLRFSGREKASTVTVIPRLGMSEKARKTEKALPQDRTEIKLDPAKLQRLVGVYELAPNFELVFTLENGQLMAQATGQAKFPVFAEGEFRFFLKVVNAQMAFKLGPSGVAESMTLFQGGQAIVGKRVR
jgi:CubicO group peptidase (beta-lactamase class C family)